MLAASSMYMAYCRGGSCGRSYNGGDPSLTRFSSSAPVSFLASIFAQTRERNGAIQISSRWHDGLPTLLGRMPSKVRGLRQQSQEILHQLHFDLDLAMEPAAVWRWSARSSVIRSNLYHSVVPCGKGANH